MMTNWLPDLSTGHGPLYQRLAERIEQDISRGVLATGAKLPPQRNLAFDIGVTIGTVTRAYNIVRERGLVSGEVGRGTYVLGREPVPVLREEKPVAAVASQPATQSKLRMDTTSAPDLGQSSAIRSILDRLARDHGGAMVDYTRHWPDSWREAGARWLAAPGWAPSPEDIVPTMGCHAAIMAVIAVATAPGDRVAFEQLTYASIARSANLIGRRSVTFRMDARGADPDDFERLCAQQHPKLVFLMPGLHNPTLVVLSEERMQAIADIARKYNVWIIEDSIYSALIENRQTTLARFAPERTFHVGGLSKAVAAGVRGGWVACPPHYASRVQTAHKMVTGGLPFILAELSAELVMGGEAERARQAVRKELGEREQLARRHFEGLDFVSHPNAPYLWMKLPEPWLSAPFKQVAAADGVLIDDEDEYKPGRSEAVFHGVRISYSMPETRADVTAGLATLRRLLEHGRVGYDSYG